MNEAPKNTYVAKPGKPGFKIFLRIAFWLILMAAFYFAFREIGRNWSVVMVEFKRIPIWRVLLSFALGVVGFGVGPWSLKVIYEDLTERGSVNMVRMFGAYHVANFFRYLPGKVAAPIYLMQFAGLQRAKVLQSLLTTVFQSVLVGGLTMVMLIFSATTRAKGQSQSFLWLLPLFLLMHPKVMAFILSLLLKLAKRDKNLSLTPVSGFAWLRSFLIMFVGWVSVGLGFELIVGALRPLTAVESAVCVFAYPASFVAGFLALFAPAGIGIREGFLTWILTLPVPISEAESATATALMIVLLHRIIVTVADVVLLVVGHFMLRPYIYSER